MPMKVALYKRVSSKKQRAGSSLEEQDRLLREYAARMGWEIAAEYEEAHSSWTGQRDQFETMRQAARDGRFERILVWQLDRFGRRSGQLHSVVEELAGLGIYLVLVQQGLDLSEGGIAAKAILSALALAADLENTVRSERSSLAQEHRAGQLLFTGRLPAGYKYTGKFKPAAVEEETAAGIREAFRMYATGDFSIKQVAERLNAAGYRLSGGKPYGYYGLQCILNNRRYLGEIELAGEWVRSREPAIVLADLFDEVRYMLDRRGEARRGAAWKYHGYLLKGILYCACGARMYAQKIGKGEGRKLAYRCRLTYLIGGSCPADGRAPAYLVEDAVAPQVDGLIGRLRLLPAWRERVQEILAGRDERRALASQRQAWQGKLERAKELYLEGLIDRPEFDRRRREAQAELARLVPVDEATTLDAGTYLENVPALWAAATADERHGILASIFERIVVDRVQARIVEVVVRPEFAALFCQVDEYALGELAIAKSSNAYLNLDC